MVVVDMHMVRANPYTVFDISFASGYSGGSWYVRPNFRNRGALNMLVTL